MCQLKRTGVIWLVLKRVGLCAIVGIQLLAATASAQSNPIVIENQQPGTSQWQIPYGSQGSDAVGQIKGYASATSVNKGENITFYVSTNPAQTYTIDVYRMGWYQGLGGRLMQHIGPLNGVRQPTCPTNATTGMIECRWAAAYTLATQTSWTSGTYLALLTNAQSVQNYIVFVIRDDNRVAPLVYQQAVTTYQAYNNYPYDNTTGKSLYAFNSYGANTISGGPNAVKVSFDRPYEYDGTGNVYSQSFLTWEYPFIRWLEMSGYDVTYSTDIDTHLNGGRLLNYRGILSVGHDEYFTKQMYDAFVAARDAGVNIAFFGSNAAYTQVRLESSSSGAPNRVLVCYRDATLDPITDPTLKTINWRDSPLDRPEQTLIGVQYTAQVPWQPQGWASYVVTNSGNWVYAGTGFRNGDTVPWMVGYEADRLFSEFPQPNAVSGTYTLLSQSPLGNGGPGDFSNSSVYQAPSGAWVFAAGTNAWSWALDNFNGTNLVDARIQRTTTNVLNRLVTPRGDFTIAASPSSRTVTGGGATSYGITIGPTGGFTGQVNLSVSGLPSGANGSFSPNPATASSTLSVTTSTSTPAGTYTLTITGVTGTLTHTTTVVLVVNAPVDFMLSASPSSQTVLPGGATSYTVTISPTGGFTGQVSLSVSGLPSGTNGSFSPNPATTSSTLSLTTITGTLPGGYTLTITGVSGTLTHTAAVTLVVSPPPDFTLSASPSSQTVLPGGATSYGATISPIGGFAGQVSLSVSGLPSGANGSFSPNPAAASSTLSVSTSTSTTAGTYTLTITGVSGTLTHSVTVTLVVARPGVTYDNKVSSGFQFGATTITTPPFVIGSGINRAAMIMVSMSANNAKGITASLGGVNGTLIPGTDTGTTASIRSLIFQVINPPPGSQTATVSWTNSMNADVGVITVSGADQATPCTNGTFAAFNTSPDATTSLMIASTFGDLTASIATTLSSWATPFTNQTLKWGPDSSQVGGDIGPGTGTTTHTWTDQFLGETHTVSGANFKAAAASAPDFTVSASPSSRSVAPGGATSYAITINPVGGFTGQVSLSLSGLPSGANGSFSPNPATASSSLSVTTSTSTPFGTYTFTITGVSGSLTHTTTVSLVVARPGVTYDNKVSSGFQFGATTITNPPIVIGSGANRAAMIMVSMSANNATNITARLDSINATLIPGTDTGTTASIRSMIFCVANPPVGSQMATVSWTNSMNADVGVIAVSGADQATPCTNGRFAAFDSSPDVSTSLTITSNSGDLTASIGTTLNAFVSPFTNQTLKWGPDSSQVAGDIGAGTGTTTHTWTSQFLGTQTVSGANFKAAP